MSHEYWQLEHSCTFIHNLIHCSQNQTKSSWKLTQNIQKQGTKHLVRFSFVKLKPQLALQVLRCVCACLYKCNIWCVRNKPCVKVASWRGSWNLEGFRLDWSTKPQGSLRPLLANYTVYQFNYSTRSLKSCFHPLLVLLLLLPSQIFFLFSLICYM